MNKHTPGPWTVEPHGPTHALYSGRDGEHHGLRLMNLGDGDSNFDANARLIAAAPEMLAALKALNMAEDRIVAAQGGDIIIRFPMEAITAAAAAVAKAGAA